MTVLTKYTHACVRLERDGGVLVIDPGVWSEPHALRGADAVLITHEHADHADVLRLRGLGVPVFAPALAQLPGLIVQTVAPEGATIAGFAVRPVPAAHALIYDGEPDCAHSGYLIDGTYHPGDLVRVPDEAVHTLLAPMQGSWLKMVEAIEFIRAVAPTRAVGIHDAQLNERGLDGATAWLGETNPQFCYLAPSESIEVD